jgi:hypothetical protein
VPVSGLFPFSIVFQSFLVRVTLSHWRDTLDRLILKVQLITRARLTFEQ